MPIVRNINDINLKFEKENIVKKTLELVNLYINQSFLYIYLNFFDTFYCYIQIITSLLTTLFPPAFSRTEDATPKPNAPAPDIAAAPSMIFIPFKIAFFSYLHYS